MNAQPGRLYFTLRAVSVESSKGHEEQTKSYPLESDFPAPLSMSFH